MAHRWRRRKRLRSLHNARSGVPVRWCLHWVKARRNFYSGFLCEWKLCLWDAKNGCNCFFFFSQVNENTQKNNRTLAYMCVFKLADLYSEFVYLRHTFETLTPLPLHHSHRSLTRSPKSYFFFAYISHIKWALPWYAPVFRADAVAVQPNKNLGRYVNLRFFVYKILYHDPLFFVLGFWGRKEIRGIFRRHILSFFFWSK